MPNTTKPSALTGALVGGLLTAPLLALFFLGERLMGLPLVPLDFLDFIVPLVPGGLITFVIDSMVNAIIALGLGANVDRVAKLVEQIMGFIMLLALGMGAGALVFAIQSRRAPSRSLAGVLIGGALGVFFGWVSSMSNVLRVAPVWAFVWVAALFSAWGMALTWIYGDLRSLDGTPKPTDADITPRVEQIGRREFLVRIGGATATLTLVGAGLGAALGGQNAPATVGTASTAGAPPTPPPSNPNLPNANALVQPAPGMRPEYTPVPEHYRIDIASRPIVIDDLVWTLPFSGLVAQTREFTLDELRAYPSRDEYITMQCISNRIGGNLISTTKWTGVPVRDVLADVDLQDGAQYLLIEGGDDFFEYVSIDMIMEDERIMFCYAWDDEPLPERNGFPLRIYIPDRYGMKQPKWITRIIAVETDERGYWVRRGWSADAIMNTTSVVDTIAVDAIYTDDSGALRVPIGGYAIAGVRGISKVEIRIDEGDWFEADLREPLSDKTWVFWRYDWAFTDGTHTVEVRAYERDGTLQPTHVQDVRPDGATGIHSASARLQTPLSAS